ncbi:MAG TPA: tRNA dimethylallyltransferase, partial [Planctomycetaceae bacterium]|nr:tRNA dimethylallyltransferase [Planctomycetaceae bacterium]
GLLEEVQALLADRRGLGRTARQALGYKETIDHLEGRCSLAEAIEAIQTRTRQFAKRQHTWFRNLEECVPFEISGEETPLQIAERLANRTR